MKIILHYKVAIIIIGLIFASQSNVLYAQVTVPFTPRTTVNEVRGNMIMTGNDIVGPLVQRGSNSFSNPNNAYNGTQNNGDYITAFIDIDNDPTTFSSSSADLNAPRNDCSTLVYAGLYWSANYYMQRGERPNSFSNAEISSNTDTNVNFVINNGPLAMSYEARYSDFDNDNSDIRLNPVTSYLVLAQPVNGCGITNGAQLAGNIAVIRDGGGCTIRQKVVNAQNAGAVGVVVVNDNNGNMPRLDGNGPTINIPAVSIGNDDISNRTVTGGNLITLMQSSTEVILATLSTEGNPILNGLPASDPRKQGPADFRDVKLKLPNNTNYIDITASSVVFDGYRDTPTNPSGSTANDEVPYVCYADITNLLDPNNYFGTYTLADMNATQGFTSGADGACGGWFIVAIYEDPQDTAKYISTSDGFVQIFRGGTPVDFTYSGFTTLGGNEPIDVRYGVSSLEGDTSLGGDQLRVENTNGNLVALGGGGASVNPNGNFFNGSISEDDQYITARVPASQNTQGFDMDIFNLDNDGNGLIGNGQSSARFQIATNSDRYSVYFNAFSVTVIEPELRIVKRVYDTDGVTEITGGNVELGDELFYDLEIENIGNEDLVDGSITITDILPPNTNLLGVQDATLPPGVTYAETSPGVLVFNIPADLVETRFDDPVGDGDGPIFIRFRAQLVATCEDLRDACSDVIQNSASATYTGSITGSTRTTASTAAIGACGDSDPVASNVLVNVPACQQDVTFCNDDLTLVAGTGYDQYTWSGPGISPSVVTTVNFFDVPNPQSGVYTVVKEDTNPADGTCMSLTEEFTVTTFNDVANPILDYVNGTTVLTEDCSGLPIPQILLCGDQSLELDTNFDPSTIDSISWQRLAPSGACIADPNDPCSLLSGDCADANWPELTGGNGTTFTVSEAGDYRILVEFDGGCFIPFYFSVFKNDYQPELDMNPIECGNDGSVTVTNVPDNFAFSLTPGGPYTNTTGVFAISTPGDVTVYAIDTTFRGCEYTETINVPSIDPQFSVTAVDPSCVNDNNGTGFGRINIAVTGGIPEYQYTISSPALGATNPIIVPNSSASNGNYTQDNLPPGNYTVEVISNRPAPECIFRSPPIIINPATPFEAEVILLAPETCTTGALVQVNVTNGSGNYSFADSTGVFRNCATDPDCNIFELPIPADPNTVYTFQVSDQNVPAGEAACIIEASIDNINPYNPVVIDNVTPIDPLCPTDTGQIRVEVSPQVTGRNYIYELLTTATCATNDTIYTVVDQINSPLRDITFTNVADNDCYRIRVSHDNTTPPGTTPPNICPVISNQVSIVSPIGITVTDPLTLDRNLSCRSGQEEAILELTAADISGGTGNYAWSFNPSSGYTNITTFPVTIPFSTDGTYTIYIANQDTGNGFTCPVARDIIVPPLETVTSIEVQEGSADCLNQTTEVTLNALPALTAPDSYQYSISPDPATNIAGSSTPFSTQVNYTFTNEVVYSITARRSDSFCEFSRDYVTARVDEITITSAFQVDPVSCFDTDTTNDDGVLSFTVTNSTSFDYTITGPDNSTGSGTGTTPVTVGSLSPGIYTISVVDTSLPPGSTPCTTSATVEIDEPDPITFNFDLAQTCNDNTVSVNTVTGGNGPTYTYELFNSLDVSQGASRPITDTYTAVPNGTGYYILVTDGTGCLSDRLTFDINPLPALTNLVINPTDICLDDGLAILDITFTGGSPNYNYTVIRNGIAILSNQDIGASTSFTINNLTEAGSYEIVIEDSVGCTISGTEVLFDPVTLTALRTADRSCDPVSGATIDGTIELTITDGESPYDITFENTTTGTTGTVVSGTTNTTETFTSAVAGVYEFTITDAGGCTDLATATITEPTPPTVTAPDIVLDCDGDNGLITITVTGTESSYEVDFDNPVGSPVWDPVVSGQIQYTRPQGSYNFNVRDSRGCIYTGFSVNVNSPGPIVELRRDVTPITCDDTQTPPTRPGSIEFEIVDRGALQYTYTLVEEADVSTVPLVLATDASGNPVPPQAIVSNTVLFNNLDAGRYYIFVEDINGCNERFGPFSVVSDVDDLTIVRTLTSDCPSLVTMDVEIDPSEGVGPFILEVYDPSGALLATVGPPLDGTPTSSGTAEERNQRITNLPFNTLFEIRVIDTFTGCVYTRFEDAVAPPSSIIIENLQANAISCNDPTPPTDGSISFDVNNLGTGVTSISWQVYEFGTGVAVAGANGTQSPVPPVNRITVSNLGAGLYYVIVTENDGTNCPSERFEFEIETPDPLLLTGTDPTAAACDGEVTITVNANGGTPTGGSVTSTEGYHYYVVNQGGSAPVLASDFNLASNVITLDIDQDNDGIVDQTNFEIWVRDDNNCIEGPIPITVNITPGPSIDVMPVFVDNPCDTSDYTFDIQTSATALNAAGNIFYGLDDANDAGDTIVYTEAPPGIYTYTIPNPGTYNVTVMDANGCTAVETITIQQPIDITAEFDTPTNNCKDADNVIITTIVSAGFGNYTFDLLDATTMTSVVPPVVHVGGGRFEQVPPGNYIVRVTDTGAGVGAPSCIDETPVSLAIPDDPNPTVVETPVSCNGDDDGTIRVILASSDTDGPYTYTLYQYDPAPNTNGLLITGPQNTPIFDNSIVPIPAGDYEVVVTSASNCSITLEPITITEPPVLNVVDTPTDYSCNPGDTPILPEMVLTITGGTAPYTINYTGPVSGSLIDLDITDDDDTSTPELDIIIDMPIDGNYSFDVIDDNTCAFATINHTVNPFPIMTNPSATQLVQAACNGGEQIEVAIVGGTGDYIFSVISGPTGAILPADIDTGAGVFSTVFTLPFPPENIRGIYVFQILDEGTGCITTVPYTLEEFDNITVTAQELTAESCYQEANRNATVTIEGYVGNLSYQIVDTGVSPEVVVYTSVPATELVTDGDPLTVDSFTVPPAPDGLTTGNYRIDFTEENSPFCTTSAVFSISGPTVPLELTLTPINDVEFCDPAANGAFQASVTGARGTVEYDLYIGNPPVYDRTNTTGLFEGLVAEDYTIIARDDNGTFTCEDTETFTINPPADDVVANLVPTDVSCFEAADGSITVNATGTDGPFNYTITPNGGTESGQQTSNVFNFLRPNDYTITVYDFYGCTDSATVTISEPNEVTVSVDNVTLTTCAINTIDVTISGNGDFPIVTYVLVDVTDDNNPVETTNTTGVFNALPEGEYQFYVIDANGCRSDLSTVVPVIPIDPITLELDLDFANVNCTDEASGIVDISRITGGIGNYRFQLTNTTLNIVYPSGPGSFQSESQFIDLPPGNYVYLVESDRVCSATRTFTIDNPPVFERIEPQITDVVCFGEDNGSIIVFAQGGTPPYSFAISTFPGQFFNDASDNVPDQHTFTELEPGTYQVFAQDFNGCGEVYDVVIGEPDELMVDIDGPITPELCAGDMNGSVTIIIAGGTPPYFTNITNNDTDFAQDVLTYDNLPGGQTIIFIRDSNNCRTEIAVDIPPGVVLGADLAPRLECPVFDYTEPLNPVLIEGPRYFVDFELIAGSVTTDITYMLTGINGTPDPAQPINFNGEFEVVPGEYEGSMEHIDGCIDIVGTIIIEEYEPLSVPVAVMTNNPQDPNEYEITVTGGIPPYTFYVTFEEEGVERELDGNIFTVRDTGNYIIRVEDSSGSTCSVSGTQLITYINIRIPNYFTPGVDDPSTPDDESTWYPRQITADQDPDNPSQFFFENIEVRVFDRYGRMLQEFRGYSEGWDGVYQGKELPSGDYWYTVILNDIDNRKFTGNFTLYR